MLEAAAGPEGTKAAQVQGYRVAGKSGTARKIAKAGVMNVGKIGLVKGCHGSLWIVRGSSA